MNTKPDSYSPNDVAELNRANELLFAAQQIIDSKKANVQHYKWTAGFGKLSDRVLKTRQHLVDIIQDMENEVGE